MTTRHPNSPIGRPVRLGDPIQELIVQYLTDLNCPVRLQQLSDDFGCSVGLLAPALFTLERRQKVEISDSVGHVLIVLRGEADPAADQQDRGDD